MAKVYGIHPLELQPGVTGAAYEQFMAGEGAALLHAIPGGKVSLLKGDRGARAGRYAALWEFDSAAARDQVFPPGQPTAESMEQLPEPLRRLFEKAATLARGAGDPQFFTDYVVVAE
ncbi:MAG TPA: hypothetical protein VFM49_05435 [Chloroflexia bacterium]|jgi:hypothetical protein|nr:hypothetical protein [Chloroflexia bacterium]